MSSSSTRTLRSNGRNDITVKILEIYSITKNRMRSNSKMLTKESTKNTPGYPTFSSHPRILIDSQFCPRLKRGSRRYSTLTPTTTHLHLPMALIMEITATMTLTRATVHLQLALFAFQHPCWIHRQIRILWNLLSMDKASKPRKRKRSKAPKSLFRVMFRNIPFTLLILRCG